MEFLNRLRYRKSPGVGGLTQNQLSSLNRYEIQNRDLPLQYGLGRPPSFLLVRILFRRDYVLSVNLLLRFVTEGDCGFFVFLPDGGADKPLDAEADNADAHEGFQRQNDLVVLVNENTAIDPEKGKMDDEDQAEC